MIQYLDAERVPQRVDDVLRYMETELAKPGADPIAIAAETQRQLVSIHPFMDGNGRPNRLAMDHVLELAGLPPCDAAGYDAGYRIDTGSLAAGGSTGRIEIVRGHAGCLGARARRWSL
ncbi:MAG: Fic family protein [Gemmatimonadota bacterium]|nr:MAG: Fic family protein [Gemmatimonadota bacterium]